MGKFIYQLRILLTRRDKQFLLGLFLLSVFVGLVEMVGISAIMPFISVATTPDQITSNEYLLAVYNSLDFSSTTDFIIVFGFVLIGFYIFRGFLTIFYSWILSRFAFGRYHLFAYRIFENYLDSSYRNFTQKNNSRMMKTIVTEAFNLTLFLYYFLFLISEIFTTLLIYILLLLINWKITLVLTFILSIKALILLKTLVKKVAKQGKIRDEKQSRFYELISSSLSNFKMIKLLGNKEKIMDEFGKASYSYSQTNTVNNTLAQVPRATLEGIGFSMLALVVVYIVYRYGTITTMLPIISMYALALLRLLPSVNRMVASYTQMVFYTKSLENIYEDLKNVENQEADQAIDFAEQISLKNISFAYDQKNVLDNIDLVIKKGTSLAFVGESGSGKSTLIDIIIGVLKPDSGDLYIDDKKLSDHNIKNWRKKIGYVPQEIYLFDSSVAQNVAFGREYDKAKIERALKLANIYNFLQTKDGIDTKVGDGGVQLSGGQKQRIGIARALYDDPEIIVLDEATSALDSATEEAIMDEIYENSRDKTLIIVAHRLQTVAKCGKIYRVQSGKISATIKN